MHGREDKALSGSKQLRLLYIADVPVEASYHGSALLYRLLEDYPVDRLEIVEAGTGASLPERRMAGVRYTAAALPLNRLQTTRFAPWYSQACLLAASIRARRFSGIVDRFKPDAILTVTHGVSWISAAALAEKRGLPLHLICHDEWARAIVSTGVSRAWADDIFGSYYRVAASRLCVSAFMAEDYEVRYGAVGSVLYPSRARDAVRYTSPPKRIGTNTEQFTCAFAGTINSAGMVAALKSLATVLEQQHGRLLIFGPLDVAQAKVSGLDAKNIEICGLLSSSELMETLRDRAHALFVPMSFAAQDRPNMEVSFPSKLTDYTAVGLPLLIYGPEYCSAVRWARSNDGVAEVVVYEDESALTEAVLRLAGQSAYRMQLAANALAVGDQYFSHAAAARVFETGLAAGTKNHSVAAHTKVASGL